MKTLIRSTQVLVLAIVWGLIAALAVSAPAPSGPVASPGAPSPSPRGGIIAGPSGSGAGVSVPGSSTPIPGGSATGVSFLKGTASWDIEMVREFVKDEMNVDMKSAPDPYPRQDMLKQVNPEFAKRIDALMAIYQAHGGDTGPDIKQGLGIAPGDGGFRSPQRQIELYKKCREIKLGKDGKPVGDGSEKAHWKEIDDDKRVGTRLAEYEDRVWTTWFGGGVWVQVPREHKLTPNCEVLQEKVIDSRVMQRLGPVTHVWLSWHNYGLAVDFTQIVFTAGSGGKKTEWKLPTTKAWQRMTSAAGDLGMTWGGWWQKNKNDPAHVEWWTPKLPYDPANVAGGPSGKALLLTDDQMGYQWTIHDKIFIWRGEALVNDLIVLELVQDGQWIAVKKQRWLSGNQSGSWRGHWISYKPPVKLFPAYIPTIHWSRGPQWRDKTRVTMVDYTQQVLSNGKISKLLTDDTGIGHYGGGLRVNDWQKRAHIAIVQGGSEAPQYARLKDSSIYELELSLEHLSNVEASKEKVSTKWQSVDEEGYTSEGTGEHEASLGPIIFLHLAWNRDTGTIGYAVERVPAGKQRLYDIVQTSGKTTISTRVQTLRGAWDRETPPAWAPSNPKPNSTRAPGGGWLRR